VRDFRGEELEKALQLVGVAADRGCEVCRVCVGSGLERAHVDLQPVAELLDAPEDAHGVALGEAGIEQLDVVPDAGVDPPTRVDELECEVRRSVFRPQPLLACDRVDALDDTLLGELRNRAHTW
jgi:hypothetical protein